MSKASEGNVQSRVRLQAAAKGVHLWRNNVGAGALQNGNFIRWGLANDTAALNKVIKSGDLIGIRPVVITPEMVGSVIGQFISRECKAEGTLNRKTEQREAQERWRDLINRLGGDAAIVDGTVDTL